MSQLGKKKEEDSTFVLLNIDRTNDEGRGGSAHSTVCLSTFLLKPIAAAVRILLLFLWLSLCYFASGRQTIVDNSFDVQHVLRSFVIEICILNTAVSEERSSHHRMASPLSAHPIPCVYVCAVSSVLPWRRRRRHWVLLPISLTRSPWSQSQPPRLPLDFFRSKLPLERGSWFVGTAEAAEHKLASFSYSLYGPAIKDKATHAQIEIRK